ncbi:preprotein translocase subunit SecG [Acidocella sp.]|jgi:preprotein translocase subunit SecG|uniref:preprotein translocase subunit SecG n=1 Tax=Acidocella sp. TaxID=50710 RepID=UPI0038CF5D6B
MIEVLLVLHVFVTVALIGVVLIQRSEGGGLGLGGGQGMGNFMTGRGTANLLTRATAVLGTLFFALSLGLALLYHNSTNTGAASILNGPTQPAPIAPPGPAPLPQTPADAFPAPTGTPAPGAPASLAPSAPTGGPAAPAPSSPAPPVPGHSGQ